jgi:hypothetical protein
MSRWYLSSLVMALSRQARCGKPGASGRDQGAGEEDAPAVPDEGEVDGRGEIRLPPPEVSKGIGLAICEAAIAGADREQLGRSVPRNGVEGEGVDDLSGWEAAFEELPFGPPAIAVGDLMVGEGGKQAHRPSRFFAGARGKLRPPMPTRAGIPMSGRERDYEATGAFG